MTMFNEYFKNMTNTNINKAKSTQLSIQFLKKTAKNNKLELNLYLGMNQVFFTYEILCWIQNDCANQ